MIIYIYIYITSGMLGETPLSTAMISPKDGRYGDNPILYILAMALRLKLSFKNY